MAWSDLVAAVADATERTWPASITYTPVSTGIAESISGVISEREVWVELDGDGQVSTYRPVASVRLAALSVAPARGDTWVADGVTYTVMRVALVESLLADLISVRS